MGKMYSALKRSGNIFDQTDFLKIPKRTSANKPIKKMSTITVSEKASGKPKLMRYNTTFLHLSKLILEMSEDQQLSLLNHAKSIIDKRRLPRNICLIPANCTLKEKNCDGLILDINSYGAYVDTNEPFPISHEIYLNFFNPLSDRYMDLSGKIIWSSTYGVGVSFNDLN
jgi:hypothetical protein